MKNDRSKAPRDTRSPLSFVGRLSKRWEGRVDGLLSELNARGETRLEELSRKLKQTEAWLRLLSAAEKAQKRRNAVRESWARLGSGLLGRAGIATDAQLVELGEELRRLNWRIERISQKLQENQSDSEFSAGAESDYRSLG